MKTELTTLQDALNAPVPEGMIPYIYGVGGFLFTLALIWWLWPEKDTFWGNGNYKSRKHWGTFERDAIDCPDCDGRGLPRSGQGYCKTCCGTGYSHPKKHIGG